MVFLMQRLKKRQDFVNAQKGRRVHTGLFSVQSLPREASAPSRVGFTVSKRVSLSAVKRNRIRRKLKEAMRLEDNVVCATGLDIVLVAKIEALTCSFIRIRSELKRALVKASSDLAIHTNTRRPLSPQ